MDGGEAFRSEGKAKSDGGDCGGLDPIVTRLGPPGRNVDPLKRQQAAGEEVRMFDAVALNGPGIRYAADGRNDRKATCREAESADAVRVDGDRPSPGLGHIVDQQAELGCAAGKLG